MFEIYANYTVGENGQLVVEPGEGIGASNSFDVDNSELGLDVVEGPSYVVYCEYYDGSGWSDMYFTSLEEAFAASKESEDNDDGYLELHLLCNLEVNTVFALADVGETYSSELYLDGYSLSGNLYLNGTTLMLFNGTVSANIYLNDVTKGITTQNCALELGCSWDDEQTVTVTGSITINGSESSLTINEGSSASNVVNNGGDVYDYND